MSIRYTWLDTPIGRLLIAADGDGIRRIGFPQGRDGVEPQRDWAEDAAFLVQAREQLTAYFAGERIAFDLPLAPRTTPFQARVLRALCEVPYGATVSYGELARRVGSPRAARAVGMANGRNPIPIIIPCHRVIGSDGTLTGFGGGLDTKRWLLDHEQRLRRDAAALADSHTQ